MEDLQDFGSSSASAKTISAELKDDFYSKLVADFLGAHYGELLELDEKPWKIRMLIQIGLMREEQDISWVDLIQWLQKIAPMFQSADFRSLIERNTTTALSLTGGARQKFLDSDVNFEFVGPICDSIGIGRRDLLEMSDFSDRAKLTALTNGLILELTNFISREKLDPVVLVSWIRNFEPLFCSDGKIQRAYRLLRSSLKNFRIQYRNNQRSRKRSRGFLDEFLQSPFDLAPEADADDIEYRRVAMVKAHLRKKRRISMHKPNSLVKEEDESFRISQTDMTVKTHPEPKQMPDLFSVKNEQRSESHQIPIRSLKDDKEDPRTDTGDNVTLLDISVLSWQKIAEMNGGKNEAAKKVSLDLLQNHFSAMLKEDANLRTLDDKVKVSTHPLVPALHFLRYICQFLFELIDVIDQQMISFEKDIVYTMGEKLGRDKHPRFRSFVNFDESAVTRYIHMASEMLCPSEETNPNYRRHWLAFCLERKNPSKLPIYRSNRIINYFEAAAGLIHHHEDVALFVSDLQLLNDDSNILLESVNADASDEALQALVCVVAVVYLKVLGPFWQLLKSDGEYPLFSRYILCLYEKLLEWSQDASCLLQPEAFVNVFLQVPMQEVTFGGVFRFCRDNAENQFGTLIKACLERMMKALAAVLEDNLKDFLPGGEHCKDLPSDIAVQMANCTFLQLMGEYPFGHAYPYEKNRPDKTLGRTEGSVSENAEQDPSWETADEPTSAVVTMSPAKTTQKRYSIFDGANFNAAKKMKVSRLKQKAQDHIYRKMIIGAVSKYGGPCKSKQDVERLLTKLEGASHAHIREVIRCELNYQKSILGSRDKKLTRIGFSLSDMVSTLKDVLPNERVIVISPTENALGHAEIQETPAETSSLDPQSTDTGQQDKQRHSIDIKRTNVFGPCYRENFEFL
ncbi:solute carrier family 52, riboflavin transporter, member 2 isoform X1 [Puntigrus tetrazona]|uniref:solute carrier family 52, riboflavin transporter, member 2 isoform X1 n=1 Tax=Puntigrus tetrazona TaxID=1606681 RepID=UPI001C895638|nr:solute carrier family 52, riboflavin transporter, member 2 isoform X1 [Puntigrus tetrazona]